MATVPHVTSGLGLRKFQADWFLLTWVYIEWCSRKKWSITAWLLAAVWQLKGMRRNTDKGRFPFCLGEEDVIHILLECLGTGKWEMKFLNDKRLSMNKVVAYRKIKRSTHKYQIWNPGKYLDKMKYQWLNRTEVSVVVMVQVHRSDGQLQWQPVLIRRQTQVLWRLESIKSTLRCRE